MSLCPQMDFKQMCKKQYYEIACTIWDIFFNIYTLYGYLGGYFFLLSMPIIGVIIVWK